MRNLPMSYKKTYAETVRLRYQRSSRREKAIILNELCLNCNYTRKHAIKVLNYPMATIADKIYQKRGPKPKYSYEKFLEPLGIIWQAAGKPCSKKMKVILSEWIGHYQQTYGQLEAEIVNGLTTISAATIDRLLTGSKYRAQPKGISGTRPGTLLKKHIAIHSNSWDYTVPGHFESDTVALCGNTIIGGFVWCVNMTDIATGWTEMRASWNKASESILNQIADIEKSLPMPILGFDSDNGSEFINNILLNYFTKREQPVKFTRSRPYRKNDAAHIEQKNFTHIRQLLGYERFSDPSLVPMLNDLFKNDLSLFNNHFIPSMKLASKKRVGSNILKKYHKPITPYASLLQDETLSPLNKQKLIEFHKTLNPFVLRESIDRKLSAIFKIVRTSTPLSE